MDGKQFKRLLVEDIAAAIKAGLLPEYEYKVRVTSKRGRGMWMSYDVCFYTWIADVPGVEEALTDIFNKHKLKLDAQLHGAVAPSIQDEPGMSLDQRLAKWESMIQFKLESFYRANPAWARR